MSESLDLEMLESFAKAATPGPWKVTDLRNLPDGNRDCIWIDTDREDSWQTVAEINDDEGLFPIWGIDDAAHIAAFDPPTALALIAEIRRLRALVPEEKWGWAEDVFADHLSDSNVHVTESQQAARDAVAIDPDARLLVRYADSRWQEVTIGPARTDSEGEQK